MQLFMPTKVYSEENCVLAHSKELAALGTKAMIVTGRNSAKKTGALTDVTEALKAHGVPHVLFDRVEENPSVETVMEARKIAIDEGVDLFIGIGGGSPMDASKAISLMTAPPRVMEIKAKTNNWDLIKLKSFCITKETISKVKRQPSEWEEIIANEAIDK